MQCPPELACFWGAAGPARRAVAEDCRLSSVARGPWPWPLAVGEGSLPSLCPSVRTVRPWEGGRSLQRTDAQSASLSIVQSPVSIQQRCTQVAQSTNQRSSHGWRSGIRRRRERNGDPSRSGGRPLRGDAGTVLPRDHPRVPVLPQEEGPDEDQHARDGRDVRHMCGGRHFLRHDIVVDSADNGFGENLRSSRFVRYIFILIIVFAWCPSCAQCKKTDHTCSNCGNKIGSIEPFSDSACCKCLAKKPPS